MKRTTRADRQRILAEIDAIPREQLPETATARIVLKLLALDGVVDLAVYQQPVTDGWVIWLRPADPADHGRHTLAEWRSDHLTLALDAYAVAEAPAEVTFEVLDEWEDDDLDEPDDEGEGA